MSKYSGSAQDEILIVDDDAMQRNLMRLALGELEMPIREAENGAEALAVFREVRPVLVVMDIQMPVMDGYSACRAMREEAGGRDAAIVLITGSEDISAVQSAYDAGAIEFITKPLDWPLFQMRIKYILRIQKSYLEIQDSRERLSWAQRAIGVGSWDMDLESGQMNLSPEACGLLGVGPDKSRLTVHEFKKFLRGKEYQPAFQAFDKLIKEDQPLDLDLHLMLAGDHEIIVHVHGEKAQHGRQRRTVVSGTLQDVTAARIAGEKIQRAADAQSEFLANMSHEMRTPINGVMGMAELLTQTRLDEEQKQWTGYIQDAARHLQAVLTDVLDFAKLESGHMRFEQKEFDARAMLASTVAGVEALARKKGLDLSHTVSDDVPVAVIGDSGRVRQVLTNLLGNAVKFTNRGSVSVQMTCCEESTDACRVRFVVRDTGVGIPLEKQDIVFDQFTQVDGSLTRQHEGTGLGLTICRELVERMKGDIGLKSSAGEGSEFWFEIPLAKPALEAARRAASEPVPDGAVDPVSVRILLAEDNAINRIFAKRALEKRGFGVDEAVNGQEAVLRVQETRYGVVLMDCQMPVMDGYEATRAIRQLGGPYQDLPIVALTAHALAGDREKCLAAGMTDYETKPVEGDVLAEIVNRWLGAEKPVTA